jgi:hypothetical protein
MATTNEPRPMRGVAMAPPAVETSEGVGVPGCELMAAVVEGPGVVIDPVEDSTPLLAGGVAEDSVGPDEVGGGTSPDEAGGAGGTSADEAGGGGGTSTEEAGGVGEE